ncbi:MAG: hypothetical protein HYU66_19040 [Armatimonadetes bacterium]|nr:hypothetical protein [Armatimonadota bacterium]
MYRFLTTTLFVLALFAGRAPGAEPKAALRGLVSQGQPLSDALAVFAKAHGLTVLVDATLATRPLWTAAVANEPLAVLRHVAAGLGAHVEAAADGKTFVLRPGKADAAPPTPGPPGEQQLVLGVRYLRPSRFVGWFVANPKEIYPLPPGVAAAFADDNQKQVTVRGSAEALPDFRNLLQLLDQPPQEVRLNGCFVVLSQAQLEQLGISWAAGRNPQAETSTGVYDKLVARIVRDRLGTVYVYPAVVTNNGEPAQIATPTAPATPGQADSLTITAIPRVTGQAPNESITLRVDITANGPAGETVPGVSGAYRFRDGETLAILLPDEVAAGMIRRFAPPTADPPAERQRVMLLITGKVVRSEP